MVLGYSGGVADCRRRTHSRMVWSGADEDPFLLEPGNRIRTIPDHCRVAGLECGACHNGKSMAGNSIPDRGLVLALVADIESLVLDVGAAVFAICPRQSLARAQRAGFRVLSSV